MKKAERETLSQFTQRLAPGSKVVSLRRLKGGIGARMHVLGLEGPDRARSRFVLRRYVPGRGNHGRADAAKREFRTLQVLQGTAVTAPRPLLLDLGGRYFEEPTIVESLLPGHTTVTPSSFESWTQGLARALAQIHGIKPASADLSHLNTFLEAGVRGEMARWPAKELEGNPLAERAMAAARESLDSVTWLQPRLVHDDYYPGNVLWHRGRVSGVVDWTTAEIGDPRADVAQCRVDLALMHGLEVADQFLEHYEAAASETMPDIASWDIFRGLRAYASYDHWLGGYHDLGLTHLSEADLRQRVEALLLRATDRIKSA